MAFKGFKTNIDDIRSRLKDYESRRSSFSQIGQELPWYRWKNHNRIRILPPWSEKGIIAIPVYNHLSLPPSNENHRCYRRSYNKMCYICVAYSRVWKIDPNFKFKWKARAYANGIDRNNPNQVMLLSLPMSVYNWVISMMSNPDIGDICDPNTGSDISITRQKTGPRPQDIKYVCTFVNQNSPISEDEEEGNRWLDGLFDLDKIFKEPRTKKQFTDNLTTANAFLDYFNLAPIDPNNLKHDDGFALSSTLPGDEAPYGYSGPKHTEHESKGQARKMTSARPKCFGNYDKDDDACLVCADGADCMTLSLDSLAPF